MSPVGQLLHIGGLSVEITRKSMRSVRLRVEADGTVKVSAPHRVPVFVIGDFVASKRSWIAAQQAQTAAKADDLNHNGRLRLWGQWLRVVRLPGDAEVTEIIPDHVVIRAADDTAAARAVTRWRAELVRQAVEETMPQWAERMVVPVPGKVRVRAMTSRWGSCNHQNQTITVNSQLSRYPKDALEYVIVHELAHLRYPNHSPDFWQLVSEAMPNYTTRRQWLRKH